MNSLPCGAGRAGRSKLTEPPDGLSATTSTCSPPIDVSVGQRIRLRLFNMSMEDHPMHLHGHTFQLVAVNGHSVDGPLKDTITLRHMEQFDIEFVADNPGTWLFHCHNLVHMMGGLMTQVRYS